MVGLEPCYPVCHLLPAFVNGVFPTTVPLPIPLDATHNGCVALPALHVQNCDVFLSEDENLQKLARTEEKVA